VRKPCTERRKVYKIGKKEETCTDEEELGKPCTEEGK
jgi:hypothetical protein